MIVPYHSQFIKKKIKHFKLERIKSEYQNSPSYLAHPGFNNILCDLNPIITLKVFTIKSELKLGMNMYIYTHMNVSLA